jgi:Tol biopolymer transport system component
VPRLLVLLSAVAGAVVGALTMAAVHSLREEPPSQPPAVRLTFPIPPDAELWSGDDPFDAAISPDETQIVFVAVTDGMPRLWRRMLDRDDAEALAGTEGARLPAWTRSGGEVAFFADGKLRQISLIDRTMRDLADAPSPAGATWFADGSLVFSPTSQGPLQRLRNGVRSDATTLMPGDRSHLFPVSTAAEGFTYVAVRDDGRRIIRLVANGGQHELVTTTGHGQLVGERLIHVRDGVLLAQRIDRDTFAAIGRAATLETSAGVSMSGHGSFVVSTRLLIAAPSVAPVREMAWVDELGQRTASVGEPGDYWQIRLSPDGRHVAVTMVDPLLKTLDVVIMPTDRPGDREKLTLALAADSDPVWSPDASRVMFRSMEQGTPRLFSRRLHDAEAPIESGPASVLRDLATDWRERQLLVTAQGTGSASDIWAVDLASGERTAVASTGFNETDGRWSPDGSAVAFVSDESGQADIYVVRHTSDAETSDAETRGARTRVSFAGGTKPRWSADGRSLFFVRGAQLMRADSEAGRFGSPRPILSAAGIRDIDVAPRSRRLLVLLSTRAAPTSPMTIVNWMARLPDVQSSTSR